MWKLFGTFFPTLFGVSYSGVEAPAARTQRRAGDPPHPQACSEICPPMLAAIHLGEGDGFNLYKYGFTDPIDLST